MVWFLMSFSLAWEAVPGSLDWQGSLLIGYSRLPSTDVPYPGTLDCIDSSPTLNMPVVQVVSWGLLWPEMSVASEAKQ